MDTLKFIRKKLITKEDYSHIHKTLGILSVVHYAYRIHEWYTYKQITFDHDIITLCMICIHTLLSVSSLIFHIPRVRNKMAPMIWPEFRLHSILFACRSLIVMLLHFFNMRGRFIIHILTMLGADIVTYYLPSHGTTMRIMPYEYERFWNVHKIFYSMCQVYATLEIITREKMDYAFMVLFPIQLSAFLMTMVRKGLLSSTGWHVLYTVALLTTMMYCISSYSAGFDSKFGTMYQLCAIGFMVGRFYFKLNKYILWTVICISLSSQTNRGFLYLL